MANVGQVKAQINVAQAFLDNATLQNRNFESDLNVLRVVARQFNGQLEEILRRAWLTKAALQDAQQSVTFLVSTGQEQPLQAQQRLAQALSESDRIVAALMRAKEQSEHLMADLTTADQNTVVMLASRLLQAKDVLTAWNARL